MSVTSNSSASSSPPSNIFKHEPAILIWKIENISMAYAQKSPIFSFPTHNRVQFRMEYSPSVYVVGKTGRLVAFDLCVVRSIGKDFSVRYGISILNKNGSKCLPLESQTIFNYGTSNGRGIVGGYQIKRDYLLDPGNCLLDNYSLTIYCEIDDNCLTEKTLQIPVNPMLDDLRSLLESGKFSDAVLLINGMSLTVHKNILTARSEVFAAMFEHDMEEKKTNRVEITDVAVEVMELMLDYIYTGEIPSLSEYAAELFVAADKYQLQLLKTECGQYLMNNLGTDSVANILVMADMLQASDLKEECIKYISDNLNVVCQTEGWKLLASKAALTTELLQKMANKMEMLKNKRTKSRKKQKSSNSRPSVLELPSPDVSPPEISFDSIEIDFQSLLENGRFSDAIMVIGDNELAVHRNILSVRSTVFQQLFECNQTRLQIDSISVETIRELLRYIYTGKIPMNINECAFDLLEVAHKFQLNYLKSVCEVSLNLSIDVDSVVNKFLLADTNQSDFLKRNCFNFICEHIKQVIQTEGWITFAHTRPEYAVQLFQHVALKKW